MHTTVVIVGAGQAGLAMSQRLTEQGIEHLVLERGRIAERWQSERWDSLRLLTPNWMSRLPGFAYNGDDPDGFMTMPEVVAFFAAYARSFDAPVVDETTVFRAAHDDNGWTLDTNHGPIGCRFLVAATGASATPDIPAVAGSLPGGLHQVSPKYYKNPAELPHGGVLVVGAAASGVQLAREINSSGRPVTLAVGTHTRMPRRYRGLDIQHWLDMLGTLDRRYDTFGDLTAARRAPSLQLVGSQDGSSLDLSSLQRDGVRLVGRIAGAQGSRVHLDRGLRHSVAAADAAQARLLDRIDRWATEHGLDHEVDTAHRPAPVEISDEPHTLDLGRAGIRTVLWATGYRPDYSWIDHELLDGTGAVVHDGGIATTVPDLYFMGLPLMRTRKSTYIDGVGADAVDLSGDIARRLANARWATAASVPSGSAPLGK